MNATLGNLLDKSLINVEVWLERTQKSWYIFQIPFRLFSQNMDITQEHDFLICAIFALYFDCPSKAKIH